jgi:Spy/CpxP family protein refolding chaperone
MKIILAIVIFSSLLFGDHDDYKKEYIHMPYSMEYLNLSKEQQNKIRSFFKKSQKSYKKLHKKVEKAEKELLKHFNEKSFNKEEFLRVQLEVKKEELQIEAELLEKIYKILTPKQRREFIKNLWEWEIE